MTDADVARFAGLSAWLAAAMTVVGAITLVQFFRQGGRWGTWNDASSVVLMLAMIPVALVLTIFALEVVTTTALVIGAIGILAMLGLAVLQALLVLGRVSYEQTKLPVLALGAVVGVWYLLTAISTGSTELPDGLRVAAAVSGAGFIAVGIGFAIGGQ
ncbi:MAG: hypothetical protein ABIQ58_04955, partial [Candidatus Limnocylindrales bacterium]